jgi:hypothetical protein
MGLVALALLPDPNNSGRLLLRGWLWLLPSQACVGSRREKQAANRRAPPAAQLPSCPAAQLRLHWLCCLLYALLLVLL